MKATTIQEELKEAKLYTGEIDGIFGKGSKAARDAALEAEGIDLAGWPYSRRMIAIRQWVLKNAGFNPGEIDGRNGPKTEKATRDWLKATGGEVPALVTGEGKNIKRIVIHCTATREGQDIDAATIRKWHKRQGWSDIGYHFVIGLDGEIERGRPERRVGSHVKGFNTGSIAVVYVGGLDRQGKGKDTRTDAQKAAMAELVGELVKVYAGAEVLGHRDHSPDLDGDGKIEKHEWIKECPCFDVKAWWEATLKGK